MSTMSLFQCRKFQFFDLERVDRDFSIKENLKGYQIQCGTSGRGRIFLGDSEGYVHSISRHLDATTLMPKAHAKGISQMIQMKQAPILVTLGANTLDSYSIKFWDETVLETDLMKSNSIYFLKEHKLNVNGGQSPTCFAFHENLQLLAVGYSDGLLQLYRGEIIRNKTLKLRPLLISGEQGAITGLHFKTEDSRIILFVSCKNSVFSFDVTNKDREVKNLGDKPGCELNCSCYTVGASEDHFFVGRNDAVYCYNLESRSSCYGFSGEKYLLYYFRGNLLIITTSSVDTYGITIFDCTNKFVAFQSTITLPEPIGVTIAEWGYLFLIIKDGSVWQIKEKDWQTKMNVFYKKNHFDLAVKVAKSNNIDPDGMAEIFRRYGDHLYAKGDLDGAIKQYCKTVGKLEASYVIRQYLDASRISNLLEYLEVVHKLNHATPDLTTLMLNCLTKLKLDDKIDHYLKDPSCYFLEPETAINVFRRGGMYKQAYELAQKHELYGSALQILLEDVSDPSKEELYLTVEKVVHSDAAEKILKRFANALIRCVGKMHPCSSESWKKIIRLLSESSMKRELVELFISRQEILVPLLDNILQRNLTQSKDFETEDGPLMNLLLEAYLAQWNSAEELDDPDSALNEKILALLSKAPNCPTWDWARALFACKMYKYPPGEIIAYEKKGLHNDLLCIRHAAASEAPLLWNQFIETCRKYARIKTTLWKDAFYLITSPTELGVEERSKECPQEIVEEILAKLLELSLLEPLPILTRLCQTNMKLGNIRSFLNKVMDRREIEHDEFKSKKMQEETASIRSQMHSIKTKPSVFQVSRCSACQQKLDFPSVHFLCLHSFHQQCFENSSQDECYCPVCWAKNKDILRSDSEEKQENPKMDADFSVKLRASKSSAFSVVAEFLAKGIFKENVPRVISPKKSIEILRVHERPKEEIITEARLRLQEGCKASKIEPEYVLKDTDAQSKFEQRNSRKEKASDAPMASSLPFPRVKAGNTSGDVPKMEPVHKAKLLTTGEKKFETIRAAAVASASSGGNPFEENLGNPFLEEEARTEQTPQNPFEQDDGYDDNLNPFAE